MMFKGEGGGGLRRGARDGVWLTRRTPPPPPPLAFVGEKKGAKLESERTRSGCGKDETCG